jgi:hypothetical protein
MITLRFASTGRAVAAHAVEMTSFIVAEKCGEPRRFYNAVACREIQENGRRQPLSNHALQGGANEDRPPPRSN